MAGAGAVGGLGRPVELSLGRFLLELPDAWVPVPAKLASRDNVLVFDISPETAHQGAEVVHPTVTVRHFTEPADGNVASAAFREAFLGGENVVEGFLLLSYEAFFTGRGLPARRHHVIGWKSELAWHSLRWYLGVDRDVLEVTLTVEEESGLEVWGGLCDRMAREVALLASPEPAAVLRWPDVPQALRAAAAAGVVTEQGLNPPWVESVQAGYGVGQAARGAWTGWAEDPSAEQRRVIERGAPVLSAWGEKRGQPFRVEVCLDGEGGAVVVVVPGGGAVASEARRGVRTVPASMAVPVVLLWADLRADWLRDDVVEAPGGAPLGGAGRQWHPSRGDEVVADERTTDWWRWQNVDGEIVAEWMQPCGRAPVAVFRDDVRAVGVPVMPGVLYSSLQGEVRETPVGAH